jgi:DmsE family decaheme c-type cytochrome
VKRALLVLAVLAFALTGWSASAVASDEAPVCAECHPDVVEGLATTTHMRIESFEVNGRAVGCEGCHGDPAKHLESGEAADIQRFDADGMGEAACLDCHQTKGLSEWHGSTHAGEDVTCASCHTIHTASNPLDSCQSCHADVMAQFQLPSHHPVREGMMACTSCHDAHSANEAHLNTNQRVNDLCYTCHLDKEGPFIFEHEPVQEDCMQCHEPHGTVANRLLTVGEPMLCLQCHDFHFHAGYASAPGEVEIGGSHRENPFGVRSMNVAFATKCSQCHQRVHGSDLPSQSVPGGGRGLVR